MSLIIDNQIDGSIFGFPLFSLIHRWSEDSRFLALEQLMEPSSPMTPTSRSVVIDFKNKQWVEFEYIENGMRPIRFEGTDFIYSSTRDREETIHEVQKVIQRTHYQQIDLNNVKTWHAI